MSETIKVNKNADKAVKIPTRGIVGWKKLYPILKVILTKLGIQFALEGFEAKEINGGLHLKSTDAIGNFPFRVSLSGTDVTVAPGVYGSIMPTVSGVRLDNASPPVMTLSEGVETWVYMQIQYTLDVVDSFIQSVGISQGDVTISVETTEPIEDPSSGKFYRMIAVITQDRVVSQTIKGCIDGVCGDTGDGSANSDLVTFALGGLIV